MIFAEQPRAKIHAKLFDLFAQKNLLFAASRAITKEFFCKQLDGISL